MRLYILLFFAYPALLFFGQNAYSSDIDNDRIRVSGFGVIVKSVV